MSAGGIKVEVPFRTWEPHPSGLRIPAPHSVFAQKRRKDREENKYKRSYRRWTNLNHKKSFVMTKDLYGWISPS
jgi:hypothetical protein